MFSDCSLRTWARSSCILSDASALFSIIRLVAWLCWMDVILESRSWAAELGLRGVARGEFWAEAVAELSPPASDALRALAVWLRRCWFFFDAMKAESWDWRVWKLDVAAASIFCCSRMANERARLRGVALACDGMLPGWWLAVAVGMEGILVRGGG